MYGLKNDFGEAVQLSKAQREMLLSAALSEKGVFTGMLLPSREDVGNERTIHKLEELKLLVFNKKNSSWSSYSHTPTSLGKDVVIQLLAEQLEAERASHETPEQTRRRRIAAF